MRPGVRDRPGFVLAGAGVKVDLLLPVTFPPEVFFVMICVDDVDAAGHRAGRSGRQRVRQPAWPADGHRFGELRAPVLIMPGQAPAWPAHGAVHRSLARTGRESLTVIQCSGSTR